MNDKKRRRPKFCFDKSCRVVYSTYNSEQFKKGFSFFCFGRLREKSVFKEREAVHENDLSHCYYTPLKGMIRFFVNAEDLWGEANAKMAVLNRLIKPRCEKCGGRMYKVISHRCFSKRCLKG